MTFGFTSINSSGRLQIDGIVRNNKVLASGTSIGGSDNKAYISYPNVGVYPMIYVSLPVGIGTHLEAISQTQATVSMASGSSFTWIAVVPELDSNDIPSTHGIIVFGEPTPERPKNILFSSDKGGQPIIIGSIKAPLNQGTPQYGDPYYLRYDFVIPNPDDYNNAYALISSTPYIARTRRNNVVWIRVFRRSESTYHLSMQTVFSMGDSSVDIYTQDINFVIPFVKMV